MNTKPEIKNLTKSLVVFFYLSAFVIQLLVITKIIPYTWVNGGMSKSYAAQAIQSVISIFIMLVMFGFIWKNIIMPLGFQRWKLKLLYVITIFWALGFIMQIAGTTFERYFLSLFLLIGLVSHAMLVRESHSSKVNNPLANPGRLFRLIWYSYKYVYVHTFGQPKRRRPIILISKVNYRYVQRKRVYRQSR